MPTSKKIVLMLALIMLGSACATVAQPTPMTPSPTASFTPTITLTPTPATPVAIPLHDLEIRSGPGTGYPVVDTAKAGIPIEISGMSPDGQWILVNHKTAPAGNWVTLSPLVSLSGDLTTIQAFEPSPSPAPPMPELIPSRQLTIRSGPGLSFPIVGLVEAETHYTIYAVSEDGLWALISTIPTSPEQWVALSRLVKIDGNLEAAVPYLVVPTNPPSPYLTMVKILAPLSARRLPSEAAVYSDALNVGQVLEVASRSADGAWYGLLLGDVVVWIPTSSNIEVVGDPQFIPTITPSPTPTVTPSPTVTASYTPIPTVDVNAIAATVESAVLATLSAQGIGSDHAPAQALAPGAYIEMSADDDPSLGPEDAPVVIIEFGDLRDPYGKRFFDETLPKILDTYGDKGRLVYRDYPILGSLSVQAAIAAECADKQNAYWDYQRKILDQGSALDSDMLVQFARDLNLEMGAFATCQRDPLVFAEVDKNRMDAEAVGINSVPTFFINGEVVVGSQPYEFFAPVIDVALEKISTGG